MENKSLAEALLDLYRLVVRLRAPGGCPWDAKQTRETLAGYLLEEAYEVVEAVEQKNPQAVCEELGDLLFQIVFMAYLGEEKEEFDLREVARRIQAKMIRRHPHVFGRVKAGTAEEVIDNWARIKKEEKGDAAPVSATLDAIPGNLPALLASQQILKRTREVRAQKQDAEDPLDLIEQGIRKLREIRSRDAARQSEMIGELLFYLAQIAFEKELNAEQLLRARNRRYAAQIKRQEVKRP